MRKASRHFAAAGLLIAIAGCSVPRPEPIAANTRCNLVRTVLDVNADGGAAGADALKASYGAILSAQPPGPDAGALTAVGGFEHLVLSGGGQHGAFGSGFLVGMGEQLPDYDVVTGVSTGALQAPLALLGMKTAPGDRILKPEDDFSPEAGDADRPNIDDLVSGYTITTEKTLYNSHGTAGVIRRARMGDLDPLRRRLNLMITDQTLVDLAKIDPAKKQLFMLILNWDTGNAEQVDMLDLARRFERGETRARGCFIDVMIAASSEPLGTPPVLIDDHLYVDAGLRFGVFARAAIDAGNAVAANRAALGGDKRLQAFGAHTDIIRNGDMKVRTEAPAKYSALDVVNRARVILVNQVYLFSIDEVLERAAPDHQVRLAFITPEEMADGPPAKGAQFDPAYMKRMIAVGKARGQAGAWNRVLPEVVR
jgi:hypothetical protein